MTTYIVASSKKVMRRLRNAAKACRAGFASRGARAVIVGDEECVFLRAGLLPSVYRRDRKSLAEAKRTWLLGR